MVQRLIVTGASGILGQAVLNRFKQDPTWQVQGVDLVLPPSPNPLNIRQCDLTDETQVKELITSIKPDVLVHCSQVDNYYDVEEAEKHPERAADLHVKSTRNLAKICSSASCWIIFISTDQVFSGNSNSAPFASNSEISPVNHFGKLMRDAELALWEYQSDAGILRVPLLYGPTLGDNNSNNSHSLSDNTFVSFVVNAVKNKQPLQLDNYHILYPTNTVGIANICYSLANRKIEHCGLNGTWHWSSLEGLTAYQLALKVAVVLGEVDHSNITPSPTTDLQNSIIPQRPVNPQLNCIALEVMGIGGKRHSFSDDIAQWYKH